MGLKPWSAVPRFLWWRSYKAKRRGVLAWAVCCLTVLILTTTALLCLIVRHLMLNYKWCAMDPQMQHDTCELAKKVSDELVSHGIKHWMQLGDSIGLLRHGGQIPWEHDIDICVGAEDFARGSEALRGSTMDYHWFRRRDDGGLWIYVYPEKGPYAAGRKSGQVVVVDVWNCPDEFPKSGGPIEVDWYPYCNNHAFPFPKDLYSYVENDTGPSWRIPVFHHHKKWCKWWNDSPSDRMVMHDYSDSDEFYELQQLRRRAQRLAGGGPPGTEPSPKKGFLSQVEAAHS